MGGRYIDKMGYTLLTVTGKASKTTISCSTRAQTVTCTAKVKGYSPTGNVTWSQTGTGFVAFASTTCTLSQGKCSVTMTGVTVGKVTVSGAYNGDSDNVGSSGSAGLTVKSGKTPIYVYPTSNMTASISAKVGETFIIQLSSNGASTGYDWNVSTSGGIQYINYTVVSTSTLLGGPQVRNYFFKAVQAGSQTITLKYERAFGTPPYPVAAIVEVDIFDFT